MASMQQFVEFVLWRAYNTPRFDGGERWHGSGTIAREPEHGRRDVGLPEWDVEWVESVEEFPDVPEFDNTTCDYRHRQFKTLRGAMQFAARTARREEIPFGVAYVREYERLPKLVGRAAAAEDPDVDFYHEINEWVRWHGEAIEVDHTTDA